MMDGHGEGAPKITRRELLKKSAISAVGMLLPPEQRNQDEVAQAIERFTGYKSDRMSLYFSALGSHYLTNDSLSQITNQKSNLVVGEIGWQDPLPELILHPDKLAPSNLSMIDKFFLAGIQGAGGSQAETIRHLSIMHKLLKNNISLATTDSLIYILYNPHLKEPEITITGAATGAAATGGGTYIVARAVGTMLRDLPKKDMSRRSFLKTSTIGAAGGAVALTGLNMSFNRENYQVTLEKLFSLIKKPEFVGLHEISLQLRNKVMALNTWYAMLEAVGIENVRAYFYAGAAHEDAKKEFIKGPKVLAEEVGAYTGRLCSDTLEYLIEQSMSDEEIIQLMTGYAELFSTPNIIRRDHAFDRLNAAGVNRAMSARQVLARDLDSQFEKGEKEGEGGRRKVNILRILKLTLDKNEEIRRQKIEDLEQQLN